MNKTLTTIVISALVLVGIGTTVFQMWTSYTKATSLYEINETMQKKGDGC